MNSIPQRLRDLVVRQAGGRCEYCQLSQEGQEATFHIDHIVPRVDGGETEENNLALACVSSSLRKEARRTATDPDSGKIVALFNPRRDDWRSHFSWDGVFLVGLTAKGRATVAALKLNRPV